MAHRLLRNIAVTIGAGLGLGFALASRQARRSGSNIKPLLSRLDEIESRVRRVEVAPPILAPDPEEIEALGTLISLQSEDLANLRCEIHRIEQRNVEQVEAFGQRMALVEQHVPVTVETNVSTRIAELEQRLRNEFKAVHDRTVDAFVEAIEKRVVGRISEIENSLTAQSQSIVSLHEKSVKTDDHLNRLLEAVEKLCAQADVQSKIPAAATTQGAPAKDERPLQSAAQPVATEAQESFATHLQRAMESDTVVLSKPRDFRPIGMALLGLAVLGFRLIR
jgi:hypothetical protein